MSFKHSLKTRSKISILQGGTGVLSKCKVCKKIIGFIKPSRTKIGKGQFCSKKCCYFGRHKIIGEGCVGWRADKVGYRALHQWVRRWLGEPKECYFCSKKKTTPKSIHWANKSGTYLRKLDDWLALCVPCHRKYDNLKK